MSEPFLGEVRMVGFTFPPVGWALCNGQLLSIGENDALFSLIGTAFGGDGQSTFAVPDLRGRVPVAAGNGRNLSNRRVGDSGGAESVTLSANHLPAHTHSFFASADAGTQENPAGNVPAQAASNVYGRLPPFGAMNAGMVQTVGGNQPHDNLDPYVVVNFIIATEGIFPPRG